MDSTSFPSTPPSQHQDSENNLRFARVIQNLQICSSINSCQLMLLQDQMYTRDRFQFIGTRLKEMNKELEESYKRFNFIITAIENMNQSIAPPPETMYS